MILSLFGTSELPFLRLAEELDRLALMYGYKIFVQNGYTDYPFKSCDHSRFITHDEVIEKLKDCEFVICQGGAGSISDALMMKKKVIAVPRRISYLETASEQLPFAAELARLGCILLAKNPCDIEDRISSLNDFTPKEPPKNAIPGLIENFLENL